MHDDFPRIAGTAGANGRLPGKTTALGSGRTAGRVVTALLVLPVVAAALWYLASLNDGPSLDQATLTGPRTAKGPVCLDIAGDFSGSMRNSVDERDEALTMLRSFMAEKMNPEDVLTSVRFALSASLSLPPTRAAELPSRAEGTQYPEMGEQTYFTPALKELRRAHKQDGTDCDRRVLIAITDGRFADNMKDLTPEARGFHRIYLAVPHQNTEYRPTFAYNPDLRDRITTRGYTDADELSLLYGEALAAATGQRLVQS